MAKIKIQGEPMVMARAAYEDGSPAILIGTNKEPFMTLSVCIPEATQMLGEDEFFVKDWSENGPYISDVFETGYFEKTDKMVPTGFVVAPVWKIIKAI